MGLFISVIIGNRHDASYLMTGCCKEIVSEGEFVIGLNSLIIARERNFPIYLIRVFVVMWRGICVLRDFLSK